MSSYCLGSTQEWAESKDATPGEPAEGQQRQDDIDVKNDIESSSAKSIGGNPLQVDFVLTNEKNPFIWDKTPCTATKKQMPKKVSFLDEYNVCISFIYTKEEETVWRYLFKEEIIKEPIMVKTGRKTLYIRNTSEGSKSTPYIFEIEDGLLAESRM